MGYDETKQKLVLREMEQDLLAIVAVDLAADEYEVIYTDGAYREFANRYRNRHFFDVWLEKGLPLVSKPDRARMRREISREFLEDKLSQGEEYYTTCRFDVGGKVVSCRLKIARDVVEDGNVVISIRNIDRGITEHLRVVAKRHRKDIEIRTFGRFNVLREGQPIALRGKAKEILALVVTRRGKEISNEEIYRTLWEGRPYSNANMTVYYNALHRLRQSLRLAGVEDLLVSTPHGQMVDTSLFECDYYNWLDGSFDKGEAYQGEFLPEYSWSEYLHGELER